MKKYFTFTCLLSLVFLFISCELFPNAKEVTINRKKETEVIKESESVEENPVEENNPGEEVQEEVPPMEELTDSNVNAVKNRKWTILVYISADNQLESNAIEDLCEMQSSIIDDSEVTILALFDRSNGYDYSNGDWTGTKLFRIRTGQKTDTTEILSEEIDCLPLGLKKGLDTELEMADSHTLAAALSYAMEKYPAENNGLIMWGHGTGWRNENGSANENQLSETPADVYKGFAYDETSGTYMTLKQLGSALKTSLAGNKLDFIGFDTCFGGEIEVAYELRNSADYFVGTEGLISASGWNYKNLFDDFSATVDKSPENLCKSVVKQFSEQYAYTSRASICAVKLFNIEEYVTSFNNFCSEIGKHINTVNTHDLILKYLYTDETDSAQRYSYYSPGYDIYLDVRSLTEKLSNCMISETIKNLYQSFIEADEALYVCFWASDREEGGLGVYFSTYAAGCVLSSTHPAGYISGKTINQIDFVKDCTGYVPSKVTSTSLLDSLFYRDFS